MARPNYMVTYDAPKGTDRQLSYDWMAKLISAHLSLSVWLISTSSTEAKVRDLVKSLLEARTPVAAIQTNSGWATYKASTQAAAWLGTHL